MEVNSFTPRPLYLWDPTAGLDHVDKKKTFARFKS
jgi:hypothetical protein